ncbi:leucine-rich repeat extensin-like protein 4 [Zingiber officinale]|uniref:Cell wall hydroxyproline-rich glycoprotein n=1 Tax=Zingiber officinale TaxID=94328 RepID=A0A8J5F9U9_ZINOF|nr:leucine-rich repeat extensin-like protein 4 [Zingiber officinale]KAG6483224.1 hypothetical protein ZIOFF_059866 [Zingiber officinale]
MHCLSRRRSRIMKQAFLLLLAFFLFSSRASAFDLSSRGGFGFWFNGEGGAAAVPATSREYRALQAWKRAIMEDPSAILSSWVGPDVCSYGGVVCSQDPEGISPFPVVAGIDLNHGGLRGALVEDLSLLAHLSFLHLNSNRLSGTVPDSFRELLYLVELDLSNNQFSGGFPIPTLHIPGLLYLDLRFNSFSGEVPDELFVKELDAIFLNNNQFGGQIPMNLWASPASVITLANNNFSGSIPASFGYMGSGLREVLLLNNKLTGCVPEGIGFLADIEVLDVSFNSLAGHVPSSMSCLSDLEVLNVAHNMLSGELPELVCDLRSLLNLTVSYNFFTGFSRDCDGLFFRNVGFDFSGNCIPERNMQRPPIECMGIPRGGLSCLRIPSAKETACSGAANVGQSGRWMPGMPFTSPIPFPPRP